MSGKKCLNCGAKSAECQTCSSCKAAVYCGKTCQEAAWPKHKKYCLAARKLRTMVEKEETDLRKKWGSEEAFDGKVGTFWKHREARNYCRVLLRLGMHYMEMGEAENDGVAFEAAVGRYIQLLSLNRGDIQGIRHLVAFALLAANRTTDCYDFLKWWIVSFQDNVGAGHAVKGQELSLKHHDVFEDLSADHHLWGMFRLETPLMTALLFVKAIVAEQTVEVIRATTKKIAEGDGSGHGNILRLMSKRLAKQERILFRYCCVLEHRNPHVLKGVVDPSYLMEMPLPEKYKAGSKEEARTVLAMLSPVLKQRPNLRSLLKAAIPNVPKLHPIQPTSDGPLAESSFCIKSPLMLH